MFGHISVLHAQPLFNTYLNMFVLTFNLIMGVGTSPGTLLEYNYIDNGQCPTSYNNINFYECPAKAYKYVGYVTLMISPNGY